MTRCFSLDRAVRCPSSKRVATGKFLLSMSWTTSVMRHLRLRTAGSTSALAARFIVSANSHKKAQKYQKFFVPLVAKYSRVTKILRFEEWTDLDFTFALRIVNIKWRAL